MDWGMRLIIRAIGLAVFFLAMWLTAELPIRGLLAVLGIVLVMVS